MTIPPSSPLQIDMEPKSMGHKQAETNPGACLASFCKSGKSSEFQPRRSLAASILNHAEIHPLTPLEKLSGSDGSCLKLRRPHRQKWPCKQILSWSLGLLSDKIKPKTNKNTSLGGSSFGKPMSICRGKARHGCLTAQASLRQEHHLLHVHLSKTENRIVVHETSLSLCNRLLQAK